MKAILIDVKNQEVREVEIEKGLRAIYDVMDVSIITTATYLPNGDCIYCDDEGLFKVNAESMFFDVGAHQPFIGNGLVVGTNPKTGNTVNPKSTVEEIRNLVKFKSIFQVQAEYN
jgi:hypothetical protein